MRMLKFAIAAIGSVLLIGAFAAPAAADENAGLPPELVAEVTSVWAEHGVSPTTQAALLDKLSAGDALDANLGVAPIASTSRTDASQITKVNTYPDGSISVLTTELPNAALPPGEVGTMGIAGCSVSGFTFSNCTTSGWYTGVSIGHLVSYQLHQGNYAYSSAGVAPSCNALRASRAKHPFSTWCDNIKAGRPPVPG